MFYVNEDKVESILLLFPLICGMIVHKFHKFHKPNSI